MKSMFVLSSMFVALLLVSCNDEENNIARSSDDVQNYTGVIKQMTTDGFAIISDVVYKGQRDHFAPTNLPESFRQDGLRVLFSGKRGTIPPNVRMWGIPLEISSIQIDTR
jgi:hypothetical protein